MRRHVLRSSRAAFVQVQSRAMGGGHGHGAPTPLSKLGDKLEGPARKMDAAIGNAIESAGAPVLSAVTGVVGAAGRLVTPVVGKVGSLGSGLASDFAGSSMRFQQLDEPLDGVAAGEGQLPSTQATVSTLSNGIRVVTVASASPRASVGAYFETGSRAENVHTSGASALLARTIFGSTQNRSDFRIARDTAKLGAKLRAVAGREHVLLTGSSLPGDVEAVLATIADAAQNAKFDDHECHDAAECLACQAESLPERAQEWLDEAVHEAAFVGHPLGNRTVPQATHHAHHSGASLRAFAKQQLAAKRLVVAGVGVEHARLAQAAQQLFTTLVADAPEFAAAKYAGGETRLHRKQDQLAHFALAFQGVARGDKDFVPLAVLHALLTGAPLPARGAPGRNGSGAVGTALEGYSASRLFKNVVGTEGAVSASAASFSYRDTGLFALSASAEHKHAGKVAQALVKEAQALQGSVSGEELRRAKAQAKRRLLDDFTCRTARLQDLAAQVVYTGKVQAAGELAAAVDAVTEADVQRVARRLLSSEPSLASVGNLAFMPRYDAVKSGVGGSR